MKIRTADPTIAMPLTELPPDMMGSIIQVLTVLIAKHEDGNFVTSPQELEEAWSKYMLENRLPCVIAEGDSEHQVLRFKLIDLENDHEYKIMTATEQNNEA